MTVARSQLVEVSVTPWYHVISKMCYIACPWKFAPEYRGQRYVEFAEKLAVDGLLTPAIIGIAAVSGQYANDYLKKVWHYLARFAKIDHDGDN